MKQPPKDQRKPAKRKQNDVKYFRCIKVPPGGDSTGHASIGPMEDGAPCKCGAFFLNWADED